jgi:hypothetical protein
MEIICMVPLSFHLVQYAAKICPAHRTLEAHLQQALTFALDNEEYWCQDTPSTQAVPTPFP